MVLRTGYVATVELVFTQVKPVFFFHIFFRMVSHGFCTPTSHGKFLPFLRQVSNQCFLFSFSVPIGSMYGIYANIWGILMVNVTIYSIHGSSGAWFLHMCLPYFFPLPPWYSPIPTAGVFLPGSWHVAVPAMATAGHATAPGLLGSHDPGHLDGRGWCQDGQVGWGKLLPRGNRGEQLILSESWQLDDLDDLGIVWMIDFKDYMCRVNGFLCFRSWILSRDARSMAMPLPVEASLVHQGMMAHGRERRYDWWAA